MNLSRTVIGAVIMMFALTSCRDTVIDPFDNGDRLFTVYGYLNPLDTLQTIRIIPVSRRNEPINGARESIKTIEAEVFSIDMTGLTVVEWEHSLKQFPDGSFGHFFTGNFPVRAGHTYRLVITKVDGSTTTAQTTVPNNGDALIVERSDPYVDPVLGLVQEVVIPGGRYLWDYQIYYTVKGGGFSKSVLVPKETSEHFEGPGPHTITLPLGMDQQTVFSAIDDSPLTGGTFNAKLTSMGLLFRVVDENWSAYIDRSDSELLNRGDTNSNVRNGAGYWGAMGLLLHEWLVPVELSQALGYDS
jgi:hypothetical protein